MEIQSLVRSGKMQRIKSTLHAAKPAPAPSARPLDRKISINLGGLLDMIATIQIALLGTELVACIAMCASAELAGSCDR